jgi:hypothetical protein
VQVLHRGCAQEATLGPKTCHVSHSQDSELCWDTNPHGGVGVAISLVSSQWGQNLARCLSPAAQNLTSKTHIHTPPPGSQDGFPLWSWHWSSLGLCPTEFQSTIRVQAHPRGLHYPTAPQVQPKLNTVTSCHLHPTHYSCLASPLF